VGHYAKPGAQTELQKELKYFTDIIKARVGSQCQLIVAGDFNRNPKKVAQIATALDLQIC